MDDRYQDYDTFQLSIIKLIVRTSLLILTQNFLPFDLGCLVARNLK